MVCLVQNANLYAIERDIALLHMVEKSAWACNDDFDTTGESLALGKMSDSAENRYCRYFVRGGERGDDGSDLCCKFPRVYEYQCSWLATHRRHRLGR